MRDFIQHTNVVVEPNRAVEVMVLVLHLGEVSDRRRDQPSVRLAIRPLRVTREN